MRYGTGNSNRPGLSEREEGSLPVTCVAPWHPCGLGESWVAQPGEVGWVESLSIAICFGILSLPIGQTIMNCVFIHFATTFFDTYTSLIVRLQGPQSISSVLQQLWRHRYARNQANEVTPN
jgi:hypothetical protein